MNNVFPHIPYKSIKSGSLSDYATELLTQNGAFIVKGFPLDKSAFVDFGHAIGKPIPKAAYTAPNVETQGDLVFIGDIRFKPEVEMSKRMPTQDFRPIHFHTARAYAKRRPNVFCMLMFDQGWTGLENGQNGESKLLTISDFLNEFNKVSGAQAEEFLDILKSYKLQYKPSFYTGDVGQGALLWEKNGKTCFRFWEGLTNDLVETLALVEPNSGIENALRAVSTTLTEAKPSYKALLDPGDIIVLDNKAVAHARNAFLPLKQNSSGIVEHTTRQVFNLQII